MFVFKSTILFFGFFLSMLSSYGHQHPRRRRQLVPHAANAAASRNPGNAVVAVAVALGPEIAEVLVTPSSITRGTRAFGPANNGHSSRQPWVDNQMLLNS